MPANYPSFLLLSQLARFTYTKFCHISIREVIRTWIHNNFCESFELKLYYEIKAKLICFHIKQNNFVGLAGMSMHAYMPGLDPGRGPRGPGPPPP